MADFGLTISDLNAKAAGAIRRLFNLEHFSKDMALHADTGARYLARTKAPAGWRSRAPEKARG
jgi:hypothetical protein